MASAQSQSELKLPFWHFLLYHYGFSMPKCMAETNFTENILRASHFYFCFSITPFPNDLSFLTIRVERKIIEMQRSKNKKLREDGLTLRMTRYSKGHAKER